MFARSELGISLNFKWNDFILLTTFCLEILEKISLANDDEAMLRPTFPAEGDYNMQLISGIEACWLEVPEMRPNIKKIKTIVHGNLRTTFVIFVHLLGLYEDTLLLLKNL